MAAMHPNTPTVAPAVDLASIGSQIVDAAKKLLPLAQWLRSVIVNVPAAVIFLDGLIGILTAIIALGPLFPAV